MNTHSAARLLSVDAHTAGPSSYTICDDSQGRALSSFAANLIIDSLLSASSTLSPFELWPRYNPPRIPLYLLFASNFPYIIITGHLGSTSRHVLHTMRMLWDEMAWDAELPDRLVLDLRDSQSLASRLMWICRSRWSLAGHLVRKPCTSPAKPLICKLCSEQCSLNIERREPSSIVLGHFDDPNECPVANEMVEVYKNKWWWCFCVRC